jgi:hypothetical protein
MLVKLNHYPEFPQLNSSSPFVKWFDWKVGGVIGKSNGRIFGPDERSIVSALPREIADQAIDPSFSRYLPPPNVHYGISPWYGSMLFRLESPTGIYEHCTGQQVHMKKGEYYLIDLKDTFRVYDTIAVEYLGIKFKKTFNEMYAICEELGYFS